MSLEPSDSTGSCGSKDVSRDVQRLVSALAERDKKIDRLTNQLTTLRHSSEIISKRNDELSEIITVLQRKAEVAEITHSLENSGKHWSHSLEPISVQQLPLSLNPMNTTTDNKKSPLKKVSFVRYRAHYKRNVHKALAVLQSMETNLMASHDADGHVGGDSFGGSTPFLTLSSPQQQQHNRRWSCSPSANDVVSYRKRSSVRLDLPEGGEDPSSPALVVPVPSTEPTPMVSIVGPVPDREHDVMDTWMRRYSCPKELQETQRDIIEAMANLQHQSDAALLAIIQSVSKEIGPSKSLEVTRLSKQMSAKIVQCFHDGCRVANRAVRSINTSQQRRGSESETSSTILIPPLVIASLHRHEDELNDYAKRVCGKDDFLGWHEEPRNSQDLMDVIDACRSVVTHLTNRLSQHPSEDESNFSKHSKTPSPTARKTTAVSKTPKSPGLTTYNSSPKYRRRTYVGGDTLNIPTTTDTLPTLVEVSKPVKSPQKANTSSKYQM